MGALSLGLLAVIGLAPEWLADLRPASSIADPQSNQGQRAAARLAADMATVKQSLAQVQLDLAKVTTELASNTDQQKSVVAQVTSLEARVASTTPLAPAATVAASEPAPEPAVPAAQTQTLRGYATTAETPVAAVVKPVANLAPAPTVVPTNVPPPEQPTTSAAAPKIINADVAAVPAALETGSVAAPVKLQPSPQAAAAKPPGEAISFGPATVKVAPKPVGIKVSSGASVDSLRLSWSLLSEKHSDALKAMQPRYVISGDPQNPTYDLVAGPVKSKAEAKKVCKSLADQGVPCTIGAFSGDSL
jgi:SPOR domain